MQDETDIAIDTVLGSAALEGIPEGGVWRASLASVRPEDGVEETVLRSSSFGRAAARGGSTNDYCRLDDDELSGLVWAAALMRPTGISDLEPKSVVKKFKDKKFAAGCNRDVIRQGAELVGLDLPAAIAVCIDGMKPYAAETGLLPKT